MSRRALGKLPYLKMRFDYQVEPEENIFVPQNVMIALLCVLQAS